MNFTQIGTNLTIMHTLTLSKLRLSLSRFQRNPHLHDEV